MIKLIWFAAFVHAQAGPQIVPISETTVFSDRAKCEAFGNLMKARLADYARGAAKLDWKDRVAVQFKCEPSGQPT
jgi:hypothetical protein